jgi:lysozyme
MRQINTKGLQLIEHFEGLSLTPYLCPGGKWTIGIGTIKYPNGTSVSKDDKPITVDQAIEYLHHDLKHFCQGIETFLDKNGIYLGDNKFSALVSFAYNVGLSPVITRGKMMCEGLLNQDNHKIKSAFLAYTKVTKVKNGVAKKVEMPGLVRRRQAELELFFMT